MARLTREAFEKWLSEQPPRRLFGVGRSTNDAGEPVCPLAVYIGGPIPWSRMPAPLRDFTNEVDREGWRNKRERVTAARALKLLRALP